MFDKIKRRIFCSGVGRLYLTRWTVPLPFGRAVYVHRFHESDVPVFHDHPWRFVSVVLWGGYREHRPGVSWKRRGFGSVAFRRAEDLHFVTLFGKTAWTLVLRGRKRREWGFMTEGGWKHWRSYLDERYHVRSSEVVG